MPASKIRWKELQKNYLQEAVKEEAVNPSRGWNDIWHEFYWKLWDAFHDEFPALKPVVEPGTRWISSDAV